MININETGTLGLRKIETCPHSIKQIEQVEIYSCTLPEIISGPDKRTIFFTKETKPVVLLSDIQAKPTEQSLLKALMETCGLCRVYSLSS